MLKDKELDALIKHYNDYLGDIEMLEYTPSKNMMLKPQLILSRPNQMHQYNVIATVGLSEVKLKGSYTNCEIIILLDKDWKFKLDSINHNWPLELMHKISNIIYLTDSKVGYGQYFINDGNKTFCPLTDMGVALIGVPAMLDKKFFEMKNGKKSTNFFVVTTATFEELKLIKHIGGINFIQRYLLPEGEDAFIVHNNRL
ncbi:MAG: suppressor of fused domain protein [Clostridia bacterium]|nr:suppressor of fused domain protein [Clostridia bacterium]